MLTPGETILRPAVVWSGVGLIIGLVVNQHSIETARILCIAGMCLGAALGLRLLIKRNKNS